MTSFILRSLMLLFITTSVFSQDDCACCTDFHKQFDFWVGNWTVYDTLGNVVGENSIVKLEDNCIINEHWIGATGVTGSSYNYFNRLDSTWNQLWIDSNGSSLVLKGKAGPGKMILQSELQKGQKIAWYFNRITWTVNGDGSVTQHWEILDKEENVLSNAFKGIYKKKD